MSNRNTATTKPSTAALAVKKHNKASSNSQKFFFSKTSTPIHTAHTGDLYELENKHLPFNRNIYGSGGEMSENITQNEASSNSQKFWFFYKGRTVVYDAHTGDVYELETKHVPFDRHLYGSSEFNKEECLSYLRDLQDKVDDIKVFNILYPPPQ